jgi:hypothetical protein
VTQTYITKARKRRQDKTYTRQPIHKTTTRRPDQAIQDPIVTLTLTLTLVFSVNLLDVLKKRKEKKMKMKSLIAGLGSGHGLG